MEAASNRIVSVVVVTCGANGYLRPCLDSLNKQTHPVPDIIVINNSCDKGFIQEINGHWPGVKIYPSAENLFYCEALNRGIKMSRGEFILCLNDDVILDKRFIEEALRGFFVNPRVGMVSGKILRSDKKTLDTTGLFLSIWRTAKERGYGLKDRGQFEKKGYIFAVNGAAGFYRRQMLEDIKAGPDYFDADYRIFYEDLDIAWRAQNLSWKAYYIPGAIAYHVRGGTVRLIGGINKPYARRYLSDSLHIDLIKNRCLTVIKNESYLSFLFHLPFLILYDFVIWGYILFFRPHLMKSLFLNLRQIKSAVKKRKLIYEAPSGHINN